MGRYKRKNRSALHMSMEEQKLAKELGLKFTGNANGEIPTKEQINDLLDDARLMCDLIEEKSKLKGE